MWRRRVLWSSLNTRKINSVSDQRDSKKFLKDENDNFFPVIGSTDVPRVPESFDQIGKNYWNDFVFRRTNTGVLQRLSFVPFVSTGRGRCLRQGPRVSPLSTTELGPLLQWTRDLRLRV